MTSNCKDQNEECLVSGAGSNGREEIAAVLKDNVTDNVTREEEDGRQNT